jgi:hypothetical protein
MADTKYGKYLVEVKRSQIRGEDGAPVFDGLMIRPDKLGYNMVMGFQFVKKPFKNNNPAHTHDFQEFLIFYGGNPEDPEDFGGVVEICMGMELEKHIITRPTIINLPEGLVHCPLEITRVDKPFVMMEIMLVPAGGGRRDPVVLKK